LSVVIIHIISIYKTEKGYFFISSEGKEARSSSCICFKHFLPRKKWIFEKNELLWI